MGTNFYHETPPCPTCGHYERTHIGKRSVAWRFLFWGDRENGPRSWSDWREILSGGGGKIVDEYGEEYSPDKFAEEVQATVGERLNHYDYCISAGHGIRGWKDSEGWPFEDVEFG